MVLRAGYIVEPFCSIISPLGNSFSSKHRGHEPSQAFITSLLEMKLDYITMFEWQRHSQAHTDVPDYQELLDFLNLRAQAAEASIEKKHTPRSIKSMVTNTASIDSCISCGVESTSYTPGVTSPLSSDRAKNYCLSGLQPGQRSADQYTTVNIVNAHTTHCFTKKGMIVLLGQVLQPLPPLRVSQLQHPHLLTLMFC